MRVKMTPLWAREILEFNSINRPISQQKVNEYANDMENNKFFYTGDSIKISVNGNLLDGQHRLLAIIKSGKAVEMEYIEGLKEEIFRYLDIGKPRSLHDGLSILGYSNASHIAAITKKVMSWDLCDDKENFRIYGPNMKFKLEQIEDYLMDNENEIMYFHGLARNTLIFKKCGSPTAFVAALVVCAKGNRQNAVRFFHELNSGSFNAKEPTFLLKEKLIWRNYANDRGAERDSELFALVIKAFNYFVTGRKVKMLKWREESDYMPVPEGWKQ